MRSARPVLIGLWAAALPFHRSFIGSGVLTRAGLGEWLAPLALGVLLPAFFRDKREWRALVPAAIVALGFLPSVICALDRSAALAQWCILVYVASLVALGQAASALGYRPAAIAGYVAGTAAACALGLGGMALAATGHETSLAHLTPWISSVPRPVGPTATPNALALEAAVGLVAARELARGAGTRIRALSIASAVLFSVTIACSFGHVVFAVLPTVAFLLSRSSNRPTRIASRVALALSLVLLVLSIRVRLVPLSSRAPFIDLRPTPYVVAHAIALDELRSSPFVGVGLECFARAWPLHYDAARFDQAYVEGQEGSLGVALDPHSTYLGYLAEAGLFGAAVLVGLGAVAMRARRRADLAFDALIVFAAVGGVFVDLLTNRELALAIGLFATRRR